MKAKIYIIASIFLTLSVNQIIVSCTNESTEDIKEKTVLYKCPMECEGDKEYKEEGICPICKMELVVVEKKIQD